MGLIRRQGGQLEADVLHRQAMREGDEEVGPTGEGVGKQEEVLSSSLAVSVV